MAWAFINIPLGSLLESSLDWDLEGGEKIEMRPLRETYPNTQISFSREYIEAHKLTYKEHECQTSKLWVKP